MLAHCSRVRKLMSFILETKIDESSMSAMISHMAFSNLSTALMMSLSKSSVVSFLTPPIRG